MPTKPNTKEAMDLPPIFSLFSMLFSSNYFTPSIVIDSFSIVNTFEIVNCLNKIKKNAHNTKKERAFFNGKK